MYLWGNAERKTNNRNEKVAGLTILSRSVWLMYLTLLTFAVAVVVLPTMDLSNERCNTTIHPINKHFSMGLLSSLLKFIVFIEGGFDIFISNSNTNDIEYTPSIFELI